MTEHRDKNKFLGETAHDTENGLAAAGSAQGDAGEITKQITSVTGADGTKGVVLPASAQVGATYVVHNADGASALSLYPASGGAINGGSANAAVTVAAKETAILSLVAADTWIGLAGVNF